MEGKVTRCDHCSNEESRFENTFGGFGYNWITVTRNQSMSQDKIRAGKSHFCTEKCLVAHLAGEKGAERPDPAKKFKEAVAAAVQSESRKTVELPSLCESCGKADVSCPIYPQDTLTCGQFERKAEAVRPIVLDEYQREEMGLSACD